MKEDPIILFRIPFTIYFLAYNKTTKLFSLAVKRWCVNTSEYNFYFYQ